jgi:hypothetical protein
LPNHSAIRIHATKALRPVLRPANLGFVSLSTINFLYLRYHTSDWASDMDLRGSTVQAQGSFAVSQLLLLV